MRDRKLSNVVVTVLTILFLLFCANLILGLGLTIIGMFMALIGGLVKFLFTKEVIILAFIGLVIYGFTRKRTPIRHYDYY